MKQKLLYLFLFLTINTISFAQVANQPSDLVVCDDDNDGFSQFDLTILDAQVLDSQDPTGFVLSYHVTLSDAIAGTNALPSPFVNSVSWQQTIFIRLEDNNTGNFDTTEVDLIVNMSPILVQPTPLELCDDLQNDGITEFDLTVKNNEIVGGNTNWSVTYYQTQEDAYAQVNAVPTIYSNVVNPQTLYVAVTDINTGCSGFTTLTIRVLPSPLGAIGIPQNIGLCNDNDTDTAEFNFTANELLINPSGEPFDITFHLSEADAINNVGSISNSNNYTNISNPQTIFVRVETLLGCFVVVNFDISVNPSPEISLDSAFIFPGQSEYTFCGFNDITIEANAPFADEITWYKDGFLMVGENSSTLIVTESGAYQAQGFFSQCGTSEFSDIIYLNLYEDAGSIGPQTILVCEDPVSGMANFDLDGISGSLGLGDGFTVSYYTNLSDANQAINAVSSPYLSAGETLIMRVEDSDAFFNGYLGCRQLSQVELVTDCGNIGVIEVSTFNDDNENTVFDNTETYFTNGFFTYEMNNDGVVNTVESSIGNFTITSLDESNTYDINYYFYNEHEDCFDLSTTSFENVTVLFGENTSVDFPVISDQTCEDISISLINQQPPRPGFSHTNYLMIENLGLTTVSGNLNYILDEDLTINSISTNSSYTTILNETGFSLDFFNLEPAEIITVVISLNTPISIGLGEMVTNTVIYTASDNDLVLSNNESSITEEVVGSYDPNDKMESHGPQIVYNDFIATDEYLYYTIRFQNVGTAEAIFVRIEDELDAMLDEATFQMLRSSHDYQVTRTGASLEWYFEDINLPAEQDDEEGSHGFVFFKIKPKPGYLIGDVISNTASIYFDFNAPIITNTFNTTFIEPLSVDSFASTSFTMYPNPATHQVTIVLQPNIDNATVKIYDLQGKPVYESSIETNQFKINSSKLNAGLYFVQLTTANKFEIQKLIIK